jgi:rhodanese-related sulfurtransferase
MGPQQVHARMDELQVIDVREPDEWRAGHVEGAAHVPVDEVAHRLTELDPDATIVMICRSGARSAEMADLLREHGYDAHNMSGGMQAWDDADLPYTSEDDREPRVA